MATQGSIPVNTALGHYSMRAALGSAVFVLTFTFNARMDGWILDIADANAVPIVYGLPVLSGWPVDGLLKGKVAGLPAGLLLAVDMTGQGRDPHELTFGADVPFFYSEP